MGEPEKTPVPNAPAANEPDQAAAQEQTGATGAVTESLGLSTLADVERELDIALTKAGENFDLYMRAKAETENVRRRAQEDISKAHKYAVESFAEALVPVMDSLEKALEVQNATAEALREGVEITLRQLVAAFEKGRLTPIDPQGEKFDPHRHQAISMVAAPAGIAPNHVVTVLQKGWMLNDRVLRPALVTVAQ